MTNETTPTSCTHESIQNPTPPPTDGSAPPHSIPCVNALWRGYKFISKLLRRQHDKLDEFAITVREQTEGYGQCVNALKQCQEQTARILSQELDRHALIPAIESVVLLAGELERLNGMAAQLAHGGQVCEVVKKLTDDMVISGQVAQDRLKRLDIECISPPAGTPFDTKLHNVCGYTETTDSMQSGCVNQVMTAGLIYRGKVLRPARVSIFRTRQ